MDMRLETLIYKNYKSLNENDKHIWSYILNNKKKCEDMSIKDIASNCNVSHTTVLRFAQKLGLNGYSELKFYLKLENKKKSVFNKENFFSFSDDIKKTMEILIQSDFSEVFRLLENADRIYAYGSGEVQKNAIKELKRNLLTVGKLLNVIEGISEIGTITNYISDKDVVFLLSLSGENKRINNFAEVLNQKGVKIISITQSGNNSLSKLSDVNICFYTHEVACINENLQILSVSQFFIINEILMLKYLEYNQLS